MFVWGIWSAAINKLQDPNQELSVDYDRDIKNANLFFSSWSAFIISMCLVHRCFIHVIHGDLYHENLHLMDRMNKRIVWIAFTVSSFISMSSAGRKWQDADCVDNVDTDLCLRTSFAVILGLVSGVIGVSMVLATNCLAMQGTSLAVSAAWCAGVARTTYGSAAPGKNVSVLYLSTWACLALALHMASVSMREIVAQGGLFAPEDDDEVGVTPDEDTEEGRKLKDSDSVKQKSVSSDSKKKKKKTPPPKKEIESDEDDSNDSGGGVEESKAGSGDDRQSKIADPPSSKKPSVYYDANPDDEEIGKV